ncbi:hypothetical protein CLV51_10460 [Chitinophaga niastensis]|uniref:Uncharacterized protein n=1 Tax=Chitinophaga niastensis TaxID=536980 RepID=A0A2P8HGL2_CHINA|nr:hypothetical protein [Chitinophaga niastensis]PSL45358.1 hypothetical protein CLV51_10460 [Chitinophaga niastensis]
MSIQQNKKVYGRDELKGYFRNGVMPTENHFGYLIDSTINKQEDGFSKDEDNGLLVSTLGNSKRLVSFYRAVNDLEPFFCVEKDEQEFPSLRIQPNVSEDDAIQQEKSFFFHTNGSMGIGKKSDPRFKVDINGFTGMQGRIGTYKTGTVLADGKWHSILDELDNCQAFEVMARTGRKHAGKMAILHATALSAFGGAHNRISQRCAHYGFWWNKIKLRWTGSTHNYALQLRSNSNYGLGVEIFYNITRLWSDELFMPDEYYY